MNTQLFTVRPFEPEPKADTLEDHLLKTAQAWAVGRSFAPILTLADFERQLNNEKKLYRADPKNPPRMGDREVDIFLADDIDGHPSLMLKAENRNKPTARIKSIAYKN